MPVDPADLYPGCYARASVNPFANAQWRSISIAMNHLQKLGEGERLDGGDFGRGRFLLRPRWQRTPSRA